MPNLHTITAVVFDRDTPAMDRAQIDMLLMMDDDEDPTALVRELFNLFESESRVKLGELNRICMANALLDLRKLVHFIAGSAGNLGLARLSVFYRAIEASIDAGELNDITDASASIRREFESACSAFKEEFGLS